MYRAFGIYELATSTTPENTSFGLTLGDHGARPDDLAPGVPCRNFSNPPRPRPPRGVSLLPIYKGGLHFNLH